MQARLVSTMRSWSACSSMSSQTQPQKVHVAFFTTFSCMPVPWLTTDLAARTGRQHERSTQFPPQTAAADAPRHVAPVGDLLPRQRLPGLRRHARGNVTRGWLDGVARYVLFHDRHPRSLEVLTFCLSHGHSCPCAVAYTDRNVRATD